MPVKATLFELTQEARAIDDLLDRLGGDITDAEIEAEIDQMLASFEDRLHEKLDGYVYLIAEYEADAERLRREAQRLAERARLKEQHVGRLKARLKFFFEQTGRTREETAHFRISVVPNGGSPPLLLDEGLDPAALPATYRRIKYEVDKEAIGAALKGNVQLSFARFGARGTSLRIK